MTSGDLPEIPRPLARGSSVCHVLAVKVGAGTMVAACGISCGAFCGEASFQEGMEICPIHDEPLCPRCRQIMEELARTGEWEGIEGDPEQVGRRYTICAEPHCPESIPVGPCWCWDHLEVCHEDDCQHGAHLCEAPVHFCERHQP